MGILLPLLPLSSELLEKSLTKAENLFHKAETGH